MARKAFVLCMVVFLTFTSQAFAQDATESASPTGIPASDDIREQLLQRREAARAGVSEIQAELQAEATAQRQTFRQQLAQISSTQSQQALERIDNKIQLTNQNITNRFTDIIENLEGVVGRIETQKDNLSAQGKDTGNLEQAIEDATSALEAAKAGVEEQSSSSYIMDIGNESALRTSAQTTINEFRTDISNTKDLLTDAKEKVVTAGQIVSNL